MSPDPQSAASQAFEDYTNKAQSLGLLSEEEAASFSSSVRVVTTIWWPNEGLKDPIFIYNKSSIFSSAAGVFFIIYY